jgi:transglutaminase-like putative cysteine protease
LKRAAILIVATLLVLVAIVAWRFFSNPAHNPNAAYGALFPTGPIPCPQNPKDFSTIAGWAPGAAQPASDGSCTGLSEARVARFDAIAVATKLVPTDGFDPNARAQELADIDTTFAFVRDAVRTEAYAGAMRGAAGTLQAGAGSPADKALLLAALLGQKDIPVRFIHAPLADADTSALLAQSLAPAPSPSPRDLTAAFQTLTVDPVQARAAATAVRQRYDSAADAVIASAKAPTDALVALLKTRNIALGTDDTALHARWAANLHDHWWLQAQENGAWIDLDPSLPGEAAGKHLGADPAGDGVDALPDDVQGTLTVRLTATHTGTGGLQPSTLVQRVMKLTESDAEPIVVTIGNRTAGATGIASATAFTASIGAGGTEETGDPFGIAGLASLTLEIAVQQPGTPLRLYHRTVVDRRTTGGTSIDPAWTAPRTAYALTGVYDILPVTGDLDPAFTGVREASGLQMLQAVMAYTAAGGNGTQIPPPAAEHFPMGALHFYEYDQIVRRRLSSSSGARFFFDRPLLALEHRGFTFSGGKPAGVDQFDIVENGMDAAAPVPTSAARANFTRGYVETFAEQHLFAAPNDGGTIAVMDAAQREGVPVAVSSRPQYGGVAIAPQKTVTVDARLTTGWWQIDPPTGNVAGRMGPAGAGQELSQYPIARAADWPALYSEMQFYGDFYRCYAGNGDFKPCTGSAMCGYLDGVGSGYVLGDAGSGETQALLSQILNIGSGDDANALPPIGGACGALFTSSLYP